MPNLIKMSSKKPEKVDLLKTEHECDEHWKLRRLFLLQHKKKFSKDRLLCLAQVFINVEILGCRYPQETMDLVASLSAEIPEIQTYRESKKHKLQRTFVRASDAAATRAKGLKVAKTTTATRDVHSSERSDEPPEVIDDNPFANVVIMQNKYQEHLAQFCHGTLERTFGLLGLSVHNLFNVTCISKENYKCEVMWKGNVVCSVESEPSEAAAKLAAGKELLKIMKNHCYTIESLKLIVSSTTVDKGCIGAESKAPVDAPISDESKGNKMLRMMGWTGGGLGKVGQGIEEPVRAVETVNRSGLGLQTLTLKQCFHKIRKRLDMFTADESAFDLEFAPDFTKEERAEIHQFVQRARGLKSKSHGRGDERRLVVSKKERPCDLLKRLIALGGSTEKYNVIWPLLSPKPM